MPLVPPSVASSYPQATTRKKKGKKPAGAPGGTFGTTPPKAGQNPAQTFGATPPVSAPPVAGVAQNPPVSPQAPAQPLDPSYESRLSVLNRQYGDTLAELQGRETGVRQDYGLDDPTNPYSRAALLQRTYEQRNKGTVNSMAARGQLYAGATQNALNSNRYGYDQSYDLLRRAQDSALAEIVNARRRAGTALEEGKGAAEEERLLRALEAMKNAPAPETPQPSPAVQALGPVPSGAQEQANYIYEGFKAQYPEARLTAPPPGPAQALIMALQAKGYDVLDKSGKPRVDLMAGDKPRSIDEVIALLKKNTKKGK